MNGILYIVATPIGNLADITERALQILRTVDVIAAEDTRHSHSLLQQYQINKPLIAYHEHNEATQAEQLIEKLKKGQSIALISDAGTPLISDPGYTLVQRAIVAGIQVMPLPGPSAIITALSAAGLPTDKFYFGGFLPAKETARQTALKGIATLPSTLIFYEAPHRILASLQDMQTVLGDRAAVVARELTKKFETFYHGTLSEILAQLNAHEEQQRGEIVVLISGAQTNAQELDEASLNVLKILLAELPVKQAAQLAAKITGCKKNTLYDWAINQRA